MSWGYHLILDCSGCIRSSIRNKSTIERFSKNLVQRIDMIPYGEPQIQHFGSGNKSGYTLVQLIETSNIVAHFVEETDDMYLDVFSCKEYEPNHVKEIVKKYFNPLQLHEKFLVRQAGRNPLLR
jgi:S-adenosylmethionine/arginine decarboxylase-like enzyme